MLYSILCKESLMIAQMWRWSSLSLWHNNMFPWVYQHYTYKLFCQDVCHWIPEGLKWKNDADSINKWDKRIGNDWPITCKDEGYSKIPSMKSLMWWWWERVGIIIVFFVLHNYSPPPLPLLYSLLTVTYQLWKNFCESNPNFLNIFADKLSEDYCTWKRSCF